MPQTEYAIQLEHVTKTFGPVIANHDVTMNIRRGEILSLLGENGSGKTTLMNMIAGIYYPDGGQIIVNGQPADIRSPRDALALGIGMIHQHFKLVDVFTAVENIALSMDKGEKFDLRRVRDKARAICEKYQFALDLDQKVYEMSVSQKQTLEIVKVLFRGADILILDEPTAVLTPQETDELFGVIRRMVREKQMTIIIITHKLHETMEIADWVYVMRHGKMIGCVAKKDTSPEELTRMMVDHALEKFEKAACHPGEVALSLSGLSYTNQDHAPVLRDVNLEIREGEIYGLAGIEGNGQQELVEVLSGIESRWTGTYRLLGQNVAGKSVRALIDLGLGCIHSDRHDRGLLLDLPAAKNVLLGYQHQRSVKTPVGLIDYRSVSQMARSIIEQYHVSPADETYIARSFSGGNQQKLIVGREFYRNPKVVIIAHPTRGVDIGVSEIIHQSILKLREAGSAILLITADFDELFKLSDRIGVIYEGHIVTEGKREEYTPNRLGLYMGGGTDEDKAV